MADITALSLQYFIVLGQMHWHTKFGYDWTKGYEARGILIYGKKSNMAAKMSDHHELRNLDSPSTIMHMY